MCKQTNFRQQIRCFNFYSVISKNYYYTIIRLMHMRSCKIIISRMCIITYFIIISFQQKIFCRSIFTLDFSYLNTKIFNRLNNLNFDKHTTNKLSYYKYPFTSIRFHSFEIMINYVSLFVSL